MSLPACALLLAGCSSLPPVDTMATGSVPVRTSAYAREPIPKGIATEDWTAARGALTEALGTKASAPSVPWENLAGSTRGTVTPLAERTADGGGKCREFLMSFVREEREEWLQGEACKAAKGAWKVDQARMLERS
ncbi:RT0821/Lpp0805 family surface protein [Starkeya koreensis]|uniref:RT0821/Lpp0805 family surface protein n=1 Tax=Ancylobacter koreensis TaxID=266121 RepID=A0ABT0DJK5_9HYPH|nr:RT0821/Lpp0805 family surface protein [Ancylobacter koreensis]MCK0207465.1 RT0821/Lpp0805 family surface protein [Ancylobacter koreensis]